MNIKLLLAGLAMTLLALGGPAIAEDKDCGKPGTPQQIEGKIVKLDSAAEKITVQDKDGTTHVLQASKETIKDYKEGDTIKAKLRCDK